MTDNRARPGRWLILLGAKFAWAAPFRTLLVVLLTLFSQVAHLLAFFLPLKIVILLGSEGIPRYFPASFAQFDRDLLVVLLGVATVGFFVSHIIAERLIDLVTKSAARFLVERNKKLVLFENQDQVAEGAYQGFARALAGLVFCLLALSALAWVYPEMAFVMGGYLVVSTLLVVGVCSFNERVRAWVDDNLGSLMGNLSALGFFSVFGYLVVDFVLLTPPGILIAILSILAGRQSFGRVAAAVGGLYRLYGQREKLDAIFFHGRPLVKTVMDKPGSLWEYLAPGQRGKWVAPVLKEFCGTEAPDEEEVDKELRWQQHSVSNAAAFVYRKDTVVWMVKLFSNKGHSLSQHEATILSDSPKGLPAPGFRGASKIGSFYCGVYQLEPGKTVPVNRHNLARLEVLSLLLQVEVQPTLVRRYLRSMSTLPRRMSLVWLDRLAVAASSPWQFQAIDGVRQYWAQLQSVLTSLPLTIHNPALKPGSLWQGKASGRLTILHWERWVLEPAGAGWPVNSKASQHFARAYEEACESRKTLRDHPLDHLLLAAFTYELEHHIKSQRLDDGIVAIRGLWSILENLLSDKQS